MRTPRARGNAVVGVIAIIAVLTTGQVGGSTEWVQQDSGTKDHLAAVHFADVQVGYAAGFLTVLKTVNGGTTWESVTRPADVTFVSVFARSATDVFVGRQDLYRSTNGGASWRAIGGISGIGSIFDIQFTSPTTGYFIKGGVIYRTLDGGENWSPVFPSGLFLSDIAVADAQTIYVTGGITFDGLTRADFVRSLDGGETWEEVPQPGLSEIGASAWVGPREGYVFTFLQEVLRTADGGESWVPVNGALGEIVLDASFGDAQTGFAVGYGGNILATTNGGVSWRVTPTGGGSLSALARPCGGTCYAVGSNGRIFKRMAEPATEELRITALDCHSAPGLATLTLRSSPCRRFRIEASPDLSTWMPRAETVPETSDWRFDLDTEGQPAGFYRVVDIQREAEKK
jgi:photosystem II stability/assembly factor-like uncharacterized protein